MDDHGDITETLAPKSEQLDAIELINGSRVFTVERVVVKPNTEQPVSVYFTDFPRPWRPGTNQRRVLGYCWGEKSIHWKGRRMELFRDPDVTYGKDKPGGTRIRALSHIDKSIEVPILISQGRAGIYTVEPLTEAAPPAAAGPTAEQVAACADTAELRDLYRAARTDDMRALIKARVAELQPATEPVNGPMIPPQEES